jgi:hypothetical protein
MPVFPVFGLIDPMIWKFSNESVPIKNLQWILSTIIHSSACHYYLMPGMHSEVLWNREGQGVKGKGSGIQCSEVALGPS